MMFVNMSMYENTHNVSPPGHLEGSATPLGGLTQDGTPPEQQLGPSRLGDMGSMLPLPPRPIIPPPPNAPEIEGGVQPEFWSTTHDDIDDGFR